MGEPFDELLARSSLGSPQVRKAIAAYEAEQQARLTGVPDEQADWEGVDREAFIAALGARLEQVEKVPDLTEQELQDILDAALHTVDLEGRE